MAITYGSFTQIKSISVPYSLFFDITSSGNGTGVLTMILSTGTACTITVTGGAKLYDDAAGTLNEATSKSLPTGGDPVVGIYYYLKLTSGTGKLYFSSKNVQKFTVYGGTNKPILSADISNWVNLKMFHEASIPFVGRGSLTKLINTEWIASASSAFTGNVSLNNKFKTLMITNATDPNNNWTGDLSNKPLEWLEVGGYATPYGEITPAVAPNLYVAISYSWYQQWSFTADGFIKMAYIECKEDLGGSRCVVRIGSIILCTKICFINLPHAAFSSTVGNQIMADLRANNGVVRDYNYRNIGLFSVVLTGQGVVDAQWLRDNPAYTSNGDHPTWVISTNN